MANLSISQLDRKVTIQRAIVRDDGGDAREDFLDICEVSARMRTLKASEGLNNDAPTARRDVEFMIRYASQVAFLTPADCIKYRDQGGRELVYDIYEVTEIGRRQWLSVKTTLRDASNG